VTGETSSNDFPTAATDPGIVSYDPTYNGDRDAFIAKLIPDRVAVVLVHGWWGSPAAFSGDDKFLKPSGAVCRSGQTYQSHGCLPRFGHALRADAGLLVAQPFDYSDKTPFGDWSIEQLAGELHKHIQCVKRGDCMADKKPVDRVDIVAHSMGGLISRAYIAGMALDKGAGNAGVAHDGSLRRLVTVGTPHYGTTAWRLTQAARQSLAGPRTPAEIQLTVQGDELAFGSPFVWNLNAYWEERVVKTGAFPAGNLLTLRGWADFDCNANYFDGIVDLASATLPNDALQAFLPDSQVRQAFAKHTPWLCVPSRPALVALPKSNPTGNRIYQLVKSFLGGMAPPGNPSPPARFLNRALVLVRLIDKTTGNPVNIKPFWGTNASLTFDGIALPEDVVLNEDAATLTASPVPLTGGRQTVTLRIIPPSGYLAPPARRITLHAGRPTIREIALEPKP
jgi:pimeloyl-ACP methyl ester carboxylesterase